MDPRKIGFILTGFVAGIAGVYIFNSWRNGSAFAPMEEVFVDEYGNSEKTY